MVTFLVGTAGELFDAVAGPFEALRIAGLPPGSYLLKVVAKGRLAPKLALVVGC